MQRGELYRKLSCHRVGRLFELTPNCAFPNRVSIAPKCRRCQRDYGYLIQVDYSTRVGYSDGINQRRRLVLFIYQSPGVVTHPTRDRVPKIGRVQRRTIRSVNDTSRCYFFVFLWNNFFDSPGECWKCLMDSDIARCRRRR